MEEVGLEKGSQGGLADEFNVTTGDALEQSTQTVMGELDKQAIQDDISDRGLMGRTEGGILLMFITVVPRD